MIRLRGGSRSFQLGEQRVMGLDGLDLDIAAGDYMAVMGPSGSGKSTLLNILGLLEAGDDTRVLVEPGEHLGPAPVAQPGLYLHLAQHPGARVISQHTLPLQQGFGGDAQSTCVLLQEDLDIGAIAGEQGQV